jgi:tetratricopeptide (TPR) repeat protein
MKRAKAPKQMPFRKSLAAMALALCTFSATGCENVSITFKGPSIETPWFSFPSNKLNPLQISGEKKWHSGDFQGALEDFDKLIKEEPSNAYAYFSRASSLASLGKLQEAIDDANKAIELDPNLAEAYENRGSVKAMMGNQGGALLDFTRAIERDENFAVAYSNRGAVKSDLGNYEGALIDLNKAIKLDPNYADAYRIRALTHDRQGNVTDTCKDLKKASSLGNDSATRIIENPKNAGLCK